VLSSKKRNIRLIDFGLSCTTSDVEDLKKGAGSQTYAAPEVFFRKTEESKLGLDMWSVGCIIWMLWFEKTFLWHQEISSNNKRREGINLMHQFTLHLSAPPQSLMYPVWRMLDFNFERRWTAEQALKRYQDIYRDLPEGPSYDSKKQLVAELKSMAEQCPDIPIAKKIQAYKP
jgi:serine/threonine protein kinase